MASVSVLNVSVAQKTADILITLDDNTTVTLTVDVNPPARNPVVAQIVAVVKASGAQTKPAIKAAIEGATYDFSSGVF